MRKLSITLLSLFLIGCDGLDLDSIDATPNDLSFSQSELNGSVLFSSLLLNDGGANDRDGFIALFRSTSEVDEIELRSSNINGRILMGDYDWVINDEKLQVTYIDSEVCTSTKTSETSLQITATATCDNGEPANDRIQGTLVKPITFNSSSLTTRTVTIDREDDDVQIEFLSGGTFEVTNLNASGQTTGTTENGVYNIASGFTNVVKLENSDTGKDSLLILLNGSLSSGTMLELSYTQSDTLEEVRIYNINANDRWSTESLYDNINTDN